jgi:hypothetical protein
LVLLQLLLVLFLSAAILKAQPYAALQQDKLYYSKQFLLVRLAPDSAGEATKHLTSDVGNSTCIVLIVHTSSVCFGPELVGPVSARTYKVYCFLADGGVRWVMVAVPAKEVTAA